MTRVSNNFERHTNRISIAITTVSRQKNYIYKLISKLRNDLPMRLVVGSPNYDYLNRYRRDSHVEVIGIDQNDWSQIKSFPVKQRACWNYWRCLTNGINRRRGKGLLVFEDDVIPMLDWKARLGKAIEEIEVDYGDEYILALYTSLTELAKPADRDSYFARYPAWSFMGTQGMYFPDSIRAAFAEHLRRESFRTHYDTLLSEYARHNGINLFVTTPCLVE